MHAIVFVAVYSFSQTENHSKHAYTAINLSLTSVSPRIVEARKERPPIEEPPEPEIEEVKKDKVNEEDLIDHLINEHKLGDEFSSNNQDVTKEAQLDFGAKQEIVKKKESSIGTKGDREAVSTVDLFAPIDMVGNGALEVDAFTGVSDEVGVGDEAVANDSSGKAELGAESDIAFIPPEELKIPPEFLGNLGNMELLEERDLGNAYVEDPFAEQESKEFKIVNRYLKRLNEQVYEYWVNPYQGTKLFEGVIKLELDASGYIVNAYIYKPSGHRLLDSSALDAIRAVPRYEVPDNPVITERHYTNLRFYYSSIKQETELMPFEVAEQN
ncbi:MULTISPECIES: TonB C-terminal domain-containing protein [unclassified Oleiphilus]|uniref:TonB C-terminal domain-containing protein n=4 Tax=Oleiphilus TaxID=141450 RepID=UPI0018D434BA|nr:MULTISPECIES: TonB C-terminal domain-containing protein [unclassified Oleiphilus]